MDTNPPDDRPPPRDEDEWEPAPQTQGEPPDPALDGGDRDEDDDTPPDGTPRPTDTAPPPAAEEPEHPRIWDPASGRWVTPDELTSPATPRPPSAAAPVPAPAPPIRTDVPRPQVGIPLQRTVPVALTLLVAAVTGAVVGIVAMLFVPGFVDRDRGIDRRPSEQTQVPVTDPARVVTQEGSSVVAVATQTPDGDRYGSAFAGDDGLLVTTAELVDGATRIQVRGRFGAFVAAELAGIDTITDVALLRADVPEVESATWGTSEFVRPGDEVVVLGALPGAQSFVATANLASIGRPVQRGEQTVRFHQMELDTPSGLVPSGGIVAGPDGTVIGMAATAVDSGGGQVVPIDVVRSVRDQLVETGNVRHPWTGIVTDLVELDPTDTPVGLVVSMVVRGSPGTEADVRQGDVIVAVDGEEVEGPNSLLVSTLPHAPGDRIRLTLLREGRTMEVELRVATQPQRI